MTNHSLNEMNLSVKVLCFGLAVFCFEVDLFTFFWHYIALTLHPFHRRSSFVSKLRSFHKLEDINMSFIGILGYKTCL